jgi:hypothetical protein
VADRNGDGAPDYEMQDHNGDNDGDVVRYDDDYDGHYDREVPI